MKKILILLISCMFVSMSMQAQEGQIKSVSLNYDTITLVAGNQITLEATVVREGAITDSVIWELDSKYAAIVQIDTASTPDDKKCIVKGLSTNGEAKVVVKTKKDNFTDTCVINVVIPVTGLTLDGQITPSMTVKIGRDTILTANILPSNAKNDSIIWISRDPSIINITSKEEDRYDTICNLKALKPNSVPVYVVAKTVDGGFMDSCAVTVSTEAIESFTLNNDTIDLFIGDNASIIAQIRPLEGTYKSVSWDIDINNPSRSIYNRISSGYDTICKIKAEGAGEAKIAAKIYDYTIPDYLTDTLVIRVHNIPVTAMTLSSDTIEMNIKKDTVLTARISPSNVTNDSIIWWTEKASVVSLDTTSTNKYDTSCTIKAGYSGEAYIFAKTVDGNIIDSCFVKVIVPVDSVVLTRDSIRIDMKTDSVGSVVARFYPDSATYKTLDWGILPPSLSRIDSIVNDTICYFTAMYSGVDTIYAKTPGSLKTPDFCLIYINIRQVDSVKISVDNNLTVIEDTVFLNVADSFKILTTVYPYNATNDTLSLFTNKTDLVDIDSTSTGVFVRALKEGTAIVYAVPTDGSNGKKDSCIVKISNIPITGISLNKDTIHLYENNAGTLIASILPANATNKSVTWSSSNNNVVQITSTGTDTVCTFKGLKADTAIVRAVNNNIKDSCVVIVQEQFVFVESDTTSTNTGKIAFSLKLPDDATLIGSFKLQLPKGFGLTLKEGGGYRTELKEPYKESSDLEITALNDSTYTFEIKLKASPTNDLLRSAAVKKNVMDIAYTIYDNNLENNTNTYNVKFVNVDFKVNNEEEIKEDHTVQVKVYKDATGNEIIENHDNVAYMLGDQLYVNSVKAETVSVYSLNGSLIFTTKKVGGQAIFDINTPEKVLIIKGSSGWANKVINQ